ncbi:hypothetical protein LRS73_17230 [Methylobacterium currus]|uniref:hypothetical protein n=1 Tax=Methylobacterium currus TaxID=2051553 RepID=UPI001E3E47DA|nr:hypothetical protein [Methylobacterium currus]UHC14304.1 hypothetical protein LRS73_17230 [Methylobacterium currus]
MPEQVAQGMVLDIMVCPFERQMEYFAGKNEAFQLRASQLTTLLHLLFVVAAQENVAQRWFSDVRDKHAPRVENLAADRNYGPGSDQELPLRGALDLD